MHAQPAIFADREFQPDLGPVTLGRVVGILVLGRVVPKLPAELQVAVKEGRFDEGEPARLVVHPAGEVEADILPAAQEVRFAEANQKANAVRHAVGGPEVERAGGLFLDIHVDDDLIAGRALTGVHIGLVEEVERADAFGGLADLTRVEGVALHGAELAPDDLVERRGVALDIDPFNEHARPLGQREGHVKRLVFRVAGDARFDRKEVQPLLQRDVFHPRDRGVDRGRRIGHTRTDADRLFILRRIDTVILAHDTDGVDLVAQPLTHAVGEEEAFAVAGIFLRHGKDLKVDEAAFAVEIGQQLLVEFDPVGVVAVALDDRAQEARLLAGQDLPQTAVGIAAVAGERQPLHLGDLAFADLEDDIDAVVAPVDDARFDPRRLTSGIGIGLGDGGGVGLNLGGGIDAPGLRFHHGGQRLVLQPGVAFEINDVDRRIFHHLDDERPARGHQFDAGEETGTVQPLIGIVQPGARDRAARRHLGEIGDGRRFDTVVALDHDVVENVVLRLRQTAR